MIFPSNHNRGDLSLVEQKKLQWAKEKEEIARLSEMFSASTTRQIERTSIKTFYSNVDLTEKLSHSFPSTTDNSFNSNCQKQQFNHYVVHHNEITTSDNTNHRNGHDDESDYYNHYDQPHERMRSPSLPPIGRNSNKIRVKRVVSNTADDEDTSGYLSDSGGYQLSSPEILLHHQSSNKNQTTSQRDVVPRTRPRMRLPIETNSNRPPQESTRSSQKYYKDEMLNKKSKHQQHNVGIKNGYIVSGNNNNRSLSPLTNKKYFSSGREEPDDLIPNYGGGAGTPSSSSSDTSRDFSLSSSCQGDNGYHHRKSREERAKWGDRGVTIGHFYDPTNRIEATKSGPVWLDRGINAGDNHDSGDESVTSYSFIRGQNAPIDPNILAERASKRMRALELQTAIKEQLLEREMQKKRDHENRLREERLQEELRNQEMEEERQRAAYEQRKQQEKIDKERKKQEIMRMALERAAMEAKMAKELRKRERGIVSCSEEDEDRIIVENNGQGETEIRFVDGKSREEVEQIPEKNDGTLLHNVDNVDKKSLVKDDEDKVLIGSPIWLRKKNVQVKPIKPVEELKSADDPVMPKQIENIDINSIALVLQSMPSIPVPATLTHEMIELNNLKLAVMLAQQMQHFTPVHFNVNMHSCLQNSADLQKPPATAPAKLSATTIDVQNNENVTENDAVIQKTDEKSPIKCSICGKNQKIKPIESNGEVFEAEEVKNTSGPFSLPHDATFTRDDPESSFIVLDENDKDFITTVIKSIDVATQTDDLKSCELCCCQHEDNREYFENSIPNNFCSSHNEHRQDSLRTASSSSIIKEIEQETMTTTTTTTTTMIRSKSKEHTKIEERPKWGVNRPITQYVKASERDPFYLRNKRKKYQKRSQTDADDNTPRTHRQDSRSISRSPSPLKSHRNKNQLLTASAPVLPALTGNSVVVSAAPNANRSRNICTEILPIKTDQNGKIFLNFGEASVTMTEDEIKQNLRNRYTKMERIMNRRKTSDDIINDLVSAEAAANFAADLKPSVKIMPKRSNADVDIETY